MALPNLHTVVASDRKILCLVSC